jgi:hypothetical protein
MKNLTFIQRTFQPIVYKFLQQKTIIKLKTITEYERLFLIIKMIELIQISSKELYLL